ncbi:MAG: class I SAM-dependent methyltransferase [Clostridia bacterium]
MKKFPVNFIAWAHYFLATSVQLGENVLDCTVGNGYDTLFLADLVGVKGKVIGFEVQEEALKIAQMRLNAQGYTNVQLFLTGHENISEYVKIPIAGAIFNLGYLPKADHTIVTQGKTTVMALEGIFRILRPGGVVVIVVYTGHQGGKEEGEFVEKYLAELPQFVFNITKLDFVNRINNTTYLLIVEKNI